MAHDLDPGLALWSSSLERLDATALRRERKRLDTILGKAPPTVDHALAAALQERDRLFIRRRAWMGQSSGESEGRVRSETLNIESALRRIDVRIKTLRNARADREAFLEAHRTGIKRRAALLRAESARHLNIRTTATATTTRPSLRGTADVE